MTRWRRRIVAALTALTVSTVGLAVTAEPAAATVRYYALFQNRTTGKCLETPHGTKAELAQMGQYPCYGWATQQWHYNTDTGLIQNVWSGLCLEVTYWNPNDWAPVGQYRCTGAANQQWTMVASSGLIGNRFSGKCLEVLGTTDLAKVVQRTCGAGYQFWYWTT
jgi:hypothetical protein